jgi:hypothetical protein
MDGAAAPDALRELVREVLREVLPGLAAQDGRPPPVPPPAPPTSEPASSRPAAPRPGSAGVTGAAGAHETASGSGTTLRPVRLATDEDLHEFVLQVLRMADNPKRRRDLLAGRLRFTLAPSGFAPTTADFAPGGLTPARTVAGLGSASADQSGSAPGSVIPAGHIPARASQARRRIERGAVTERAVQAAAGAGARLVLGPRAVLTPLARDRARALGVPIEKER